MKRLLLLLACAGTLLSLPSCARNYHSFEIYFWSSANSGGHYHLYLNHRYAGEVPCIGPQMDNRKLRDEALHHHLRSGHYQVELKDDQGHVAYQERLTILLSRNDKTISNETGDTNAGSRLVLKGNDVIEEFYPKGPA
jgi:hypothetical protein